MRGSSPSAAALSYACGRSRGRDTHLLAYQPRADSSHTAWRAERQTYRAGQWQLPRHQQRRRPYLRATTGRHTGLLGQRRPRAGIASRRTRASLRSAAGGRSHVHCASDGTPPPVGARTTMASCLPPEGDAPHGHQQRGGVRVRPAGRTATVVCWGANDHGQSSPPEGEVLHSHQQRGLAFACGLRADGSVVCWGSNEEDQASPPEKAGGSVSISSGHLPCLRAARGRQPVLLGEQRERQSVCPASPMSSIPSPGGRNHTCGQRSDGGRSVLGPQS